MVPTVLAGALGWPAVAEVSSVTGEAGSVRVERAIAGGTQSIMQVAVTAPQNQPRKINDQQHHDHSQ